MKKLERYRDFEKLIEDKESFILYAHVENCGVCRVDMPKVRALAEIYKMDLYDALMEDLPEIRGQLGIFTVPVAILYYQGREYHRQARIIDMSELEGRIKEVSENMQDFGG
jgi:hypothetical protein